MGEEPPEFEVLIPEEMAERAEELQRAMVHPAVARQVPYLDGMENIMRAIIALLRGQSPADAYVIDKLQYGLVCMGYDGYALAPLPPERCGLNPCPFHETHPRGSRS